MSIDSKIRRKPSLSADDKVANTPADIIIDADSVRKSIFSFPGEDEEGPNEPWNVFKEVELWAPNQVIADLDLLDPNITWEDHLDIQEQVAIQTAYANKTLNQDKSIPTVEDAKARWIIDNESRDLINEFLKSTPRHVIKADYDMYFSATKETIEETLNSILVSLSTQLINEREMPIIYIDEYITDWLASNKYISRSTGTKHKGVTEYGTYDIPGSVCFSKLYTYDNRFTNSRESWSSGWDSEDGTHHTHSVEAHMIMVVKGKTVWVTVNNELETVYT